MEDDYFGLIDITVKNGIKDAVDFYTLVTKCAGIHPLEIVHSLNRIHQNGMLDDHTYQQIMHNISEPKQYLNNDHCPKILPVPHQVDFDWRFSESGIKIFVGHIDRLINNQSYTRIAFIGSPSLFRHYCESNSKAAEFFLIDFNANKHINKEKLPGNVHVVNCNLNYDLDTELKVDQIHADLVVMDPPWYPEYYKKFFDISDIIGEAECLVYGVFPPMLTRESISAERYDINTYVSKLGFGELKYDPLCVEYYTPPFEQNVLKTNGICNYPMCWRRGDFFTTARSKKASIYKGITEIIIRNGGWTEKSIEIVRFKLRQSTFSEDVEFNIRLDSLYENDIYPSVSRRFKGHEKINVWTSGNRVYYCSNIPVLFMIFEHLYDSDIVKSFENEYDEIIPDFQKVQIRKIQNSFRTIVDLELKEYGEWIR
jgi:hypothetical protein